MQPTITKRLKPPPGAEASQGNYTLAYGMANQISGVKTTVDVKKVGQESGRSVWCAMTMGNGTWIQVGYRESGAPVLEYYYGTALTDLTVVGQSPIKMNEPNSFFIRHVANGYWEVGRNGLSVIRFYTGADYGWNSQTGIEFYGSNQKFPELRFYPAIQVQVNSVNEWVDPIASYVTYCGKWGLSGQLQKSFLSYNEILMGGKNERLPVNTFLYSSFKL